MKWSIQTCCSSRPQSVTGYVDVTNSDICCQWSWEILHKSLTTYLSVFSCLVALSASRANSSTLSTRWLAARLELQCVNRKYVRIQCTRLLSLFLACCSAVNIDRSKNFRYSDLHTETISVPTCTQCKQRMPCIPNYICSKDSKHDCYVSENCIPRVPACSAYIALVALLRQPEMLSDSESIQLLIS